MMKYILCIAISITTIMSTTAQIGIGTTEPDASAALHLATSTTVNQGLLLPRMTTAERDANILSPTAGIMIFNQTESEFQLSTAGNGWVNLVAYATSVAATGTTTSTGKIGIGTATPDANTVLDVTSSDKGVLLPLLVVDPAIIAGLIYYNTNTNKVRGCNGTIWSDLN